MRTRDGLKLVTLSLFLAAAAYFSIAVTRFRFVHHWLTETQLAMHLDDAIMWRTLPR